MFFPCIIKDGKMEGFNRGAFHAHILKQKDGKYVLTMERDYPTRSNRENKYYWGCVLKLISEDTGYTPDEAHQILAEMFLKYEKHGRGFVKSTTKLKTIEFEDYMEQVRRFAAMELHINIPKPNEVIK